MIQNQYYKNEDSPYYIGYMRQNIQFLEEGDRMKMLNNNILSRMNSPEFLKVYDSLLLKLPKTIVRKEGKSNNQYKKTIILSRTNLSSEMKELGSKTRIVRFGLSRIVKTVDFEITFGDKEVNTTEYSIELL